MNFEKCSLRAVLDTVGRLNRAEQARLFHVASELNQDSSFQQFGQKGQVRHWSIVFNTLLSKLDFFRSGETLASLKAAGNTLDCNDVFTISVIVGRRWSISFLRSQDFRTW